MSKNTVYLYYPAAPIDRAALDRLATGLQRSVAAINPDIYNFGILSRHLEKRIEISGVDGALAREVFERHAGEIGKFTKCDKKSVATYTGEGFSRTKKWHFEYGPETDLTPKRPEKIVALKPQG